MASTVLGFIYCLQHPITGEIFYVGCTETSLKNRLKLHYQHLKEFNEGKRNENKRYLYLKNLLPLKCEIILLEIVVNDDLEKKEKFWIKKFFSINPNLTNETFGSKGGDTFTLKSKEQKEIKKNILSKKNKGIKRSKEFIENLSINRTGLKSPVCKKLNDPLVCIEDKIYFNYAFEVSDFLKNEYAFYNIKKYLKKEKFKIYNKTWNWLSNVNDLHDIVHYASAGKHI